MSAFLSKITDKVFYGWVVVLVGFTISAISFGIRYSFGVFFKSIEGEFVLTRAATSAIFSICMVLSGVCSFFGGWALDKYGPKITTFIMGLFAGLSLLLTSQTSAAWQLYISYGLLFALGSGPVFTVVNSTVVRWFDKRRGFALGIASAGSGGGMIFMAPLVTYIISEFNWRIAFIVLALIAWLMMATLALLLRRDPAEVGLLPDGVKPEAAEIKLQNSANITQPTGLSLPEASRTSNFWFLGFVWFLLSVSVHLILTHSVPHAIDLGISPMDAAVILSLVGVAAICGRVVGGMVSDSIGRKAPAITSALLQVIILMWIIWIRELWAFYLFAVLFGFSWGGLGNQVAALIGDIFGIRHIGAIMGALVAGWTIGGAIGPAIGGFAFDVNSSYTLAFAIGSAGMLLAALFASLIRPKRIQSKGPVAITPH